MDVEERNGSTNNSGVGPNAEQRKFPFLGEFGTHVSPCKILQSKLSGLFKLAAIGRKEGSIFY